MTYPPPEFRIEFRSWGLHAFCEKCNGIAEIEFTGFDPSLPKFRFKCNECKKESEYKFYTPVSGLPRKPVYKPRTKKVHN